MSLHEYLVEHGFDQKVILRIERGYYQGKPLTTYCKTDEEYIAMATWILDPETIGYRGGWI